MKKKIKYFLYLIIFIFNIYFFYDTLIKRTYVNNYNYDSKHYSGVIASDLYNIYSTKGVEELLYRYPDHRILGDIIVVKKSYQKLEDNGYVLDCELNYNYIKNEILLPICKTTKRFKEKSINLIRNDFYKIKNLEKLIFELESKVGLESINDFITLLISSYYNQYFYNISIDEGYDKLSNSTEENNTPVNNILNYKFITELKGYNVTKINEKKDKYNNNYYLEYLISNKNFTCKVSIKNLLLENKEIYKSFNDRKWPKLKIDSNCG
jgi:hypothetical protein